MRPAFNVEVDGRQDVTRAIRDRLLSLTLSDRSGWESDRLTIRIDDCDESLEPPRRGARLSLRLGYAGALAEMGAYVVDEVAVTAPPATMTIVARGADFRETLKERRTESWDALTLGEIATKIASRHGLRVRVAASLAGARIDHLDQAGESDMHLLSRLATDYGALFKLDARRLAIALAGAGETASGSTLPPVALRPADLGTYRISLTDRLRYQSATAAWQSFGDARTRVERAGDGAPAYALTELFGSQSRALAAARAKLDALRRYPATLDAEARPGNPSLAAGVPISLDDFRHGVPARWIATSVTHRLDSRGAYSTEVRADQVPDL